MDTDIKIMTPKTKKCTKCNKDFPNTSEYFYSRPYTTKSGLKRCFISYCKSCKNRKDTIRQKNRRKYDITYRTAINLYIKKWRKKNPEKYAKQKIKSNIYCKKGVKEFNDWYIKSLIRISMKTTEDCDISVKDIPQWFVNLKYKQLKLKRKWKLLKNQKK